MKKSTAYIPAICTMLLTACLLPAQTPGTGHVQIKTLETYSGTPALSRPASIVVYNFAATPEEVALNKAALSRIRTRVGGNADDQKTELAHKIIGSFSDALIKELEKTGLPVTRGVTGEQPPDDSLAIQGDFLTIDEGNRARRMAVGLGAGASKVVSNVQCFVRKPQKNVMVTSFQATSRSSLKPGAAETMGAGAAPEVAAAASGATEMKQGAEGDADRMAKAIARHVRKVMAEQGWISPAS